MPGLVVFNRRWMVASDELVIPFGLAFIFRTLWLLAVVIIYIIYHEQETNEEHPPECILSQTHIYFIIYLILLFLSTINDATVAFISSRGTIFDKKARQKIPFFLYIRLIMLILEASIAGYGVYYVYFKAKYCFLGYDKTLSRLVVIFNTIWVFGCLIIIWFVFDSAGGLWYELEQRANKKNVRRYQSVDTIEFVKKITEKNEKYWTKACKLLFCCTKAENSRDNVLLFASKLFTDYFHSYHDLVPSDILAGMILLRQKQKYEEYKRVEKELEHTDSSYQQVTFHKKFKTIRRHQKTINAIPFDNNNQDDMRILDDITYFANYALASYGWPMYCFLNNIPICRTAGCRLVKRMTCCSTCCQGNEPPITDGDNCCLCNLAAQKVILDINNDNFIYVSYESVVFKTPFSVIVDNFRNAIVISCRGTLSLPDILTDLAIEEVQIPGCNETWTAHKGFLEVATAIKKIIEEKELIKKAQEFDVDKGTRDYKLVIVGHSLGGGTASLLAFLLKPQYPDLICYAYAPPGATVNYEASCYARSFIHSIILGKDLVGRLNLYTLNELQHNIVQMLEKTKLPKWKILRGCMCQCVLCCTRAGSHSFDDYFGNEEEIMNFEPYNQQQDKRLYMAGKVVHICKTKSIYSRFGGKKSSEFKGYWSTPEDFQNILISNLMLQDHYPDALIKALGSLLVNDEEEYVFIGRSPAEEGSASININLSDDSELNQDVIIRTHELNETSPLMPDDPGSPTIVIT